MKDIDLEKLALDITEHLFDTGSADDEATEEALALVISKLKPLFETVEAAQRERDELIKNHRNHAARLIDERGQLRQRAEAAETELKRRDAQKPVWWWMHRSDQSYHEGLLINDELDVTKPDNENTYWKKYPLYAAAPAAAPAAVLPPERHFTEQEWSSEYERTHMLGQAKGWHDCREAAKALGCQPEKVVKLPTVRNRFGPKGSIYLNEMTAALEEAGVKWVEG